MNSVDQEFILIIILWILGAIVSIWISWAVIRSAVLSALRKHASEQREESQHRA